MDEESFEVRVLTGGDEALWTLRVSRPEGWYDLLVRLSDGRDRAWQAQGPDLFEALMKLRLKLEPAGVQLCCNGAMRNAWASAMQRDMAVGFAVYLTRLGETGQPPFTETLGPAPCDDCGTVAEQQAFHDRWRASRPAQHSAPPRSRWSWLRRD